MTPRLAISIVHLPGAREDLLGRIVARLNAQIASVDERVLLRVVDDPEPDAPTPSGWRASLAAWHWHADDGYADHALMLQDDSWPCLDFVAAVLLTTRLAAGRPVSYWHNRRPLTEQAERFRRPWAACGVRGSGQALHLPGAHVGPMLQFVHRIETTGPRTTKGYPPPGPEGYAYWHPDRPWNRGTENRPLDYMRSVGLTVWATCPSLIEHALPADSLLGHNRASRVAHRFADDVTPDGQSVLGLDWKRTP